MRLHQNTVFKEDTFFFSVVSKFRPAPVETQRRVPYKVILNHPWNMFWLSEILSAKYFLSFSANKLQSAFQLQCIYISWSAFFKYMTTIIKSDEQALSKSKEMFHEFICHSAQDQKIFYQRHEQGQRYYKVRTGLKANASFFLLVIGDKNYEFLCSWPERRHCGGNMKLFRAWSTHANYSLGKRFDVASACTLFKLSPDKSLLLWFRVFLTA